MLVTLAVLSEKLQGAPPLSINVEAARAAGVDARRCVRPPCAVRTVSGGRRSLPP